MQCRSRALIYRYFISLSLLGALSVMFSSCGSAPFFPVNAPISSLHVVDPSPSPIVRAEPRNVTNVDFRNAGVSSSSYTSSSSISRYDDIEKRLDEQELYQRERDEKEDEYRARAEEREHEREQRRQDREYQRAQEREREREQRDTERRERFLQKNKSDLQEALRKKFGKQ